MAESTLTVDGLLEQQTEKRARYLEAQGAYEQAKRNLRETKNDLVLFNSRYGRVLEVIED